MKGKIEFSQIEVYEIKMLIKLKELASILEQKSIRRKIRKIGFYYSDYVFLGLAPAWSDPYINNVFHIGFGMMTLSLLYMRQNILRYLFSNKFVQLSGMMCYSLYLWHGNMRWFFIMDYSALRISSYLFFLFFLSFLTYRYIEFGNKKLGDILPE